MDQLRIAVPEYARKIGIENCLIFDSKLLVPEQRIKDLCRENKCGNYNSHYMCPPHIGSMEEIKIRLKKFERGILLQYSKPLDVRNDIEGLKETKIDFHNKILLLEKFIIDQGIIKVWGMIGGSCVLCNECRAKFNKVCPYPDKARTTLESISIDVLTLLDRFNMDNQFHRDRITWTGCILV